MKKRALTASLYLAWILGFGILFATIVSAYDSLSSNIDPLHGFATQTGSNSSAVWFSTGTISGSTYYTQYMNSGDDSAIIGNYLHGYYYDSALGFYQLDWDTDPTNNVRVVDSTDKCPSGYGYKFAGFARGADYGSGSISGFMNFAYSSDIYVYYCEVDSSLHGYAYDPDYGFQNFEGIQFSIASTSTNSPLLGTSDPFFVNNSSVILTAPAGFDTVQGDEVSSDWGKSAVFYIVK